MIEHNEIKQGNIIKLNGKDYRVEINASTGGVKLIYLPVAQYISFEVEVVK